MERSGFEPSAPTSPFHRKIAREFGGLFCFDKKQQSWRDNHRHILATLIFSHPHRFLLFAHGLLLSAARPMPDCVPQRSLRIDGPSKSRICSRTALAAWKTGPRDSFAVESGALFFRMSLPLFSALFFGLKLQRADCHSFAARLSGNVIRLHLQTFLLYSNKKKGRNRPYNA